MCKCGVSTGGLKKVWERDLGVTFNNDDWSTLVEQMFLPMRDARSKLIQYKIFNRICFTLARPQVIGLIPSGLSWRCNSSQGDIVHMFFGCPQTVADLLHDHWSLARNPVCVYAS